MKNALLDIPPALKTIAASVEEALATGKRCFIPFSIYSTWQPSALNLLINHDVIRKEKSKRLDYVMCLCGTGEQLPVQHHPHTKQPFIQCFACGDIHSFSAEVLEYYESSPLHIATFLARILGDLEQPETLIGDKVFFVGETPEDVMVYAAFGLNNHNIQDSFSRCKTHSQGQSFITLAPHIPSSIPQEYKMLPLCERKLYLTNSTAIGLDISYLNSSFIKKTHNQEAANIRWKNDPRKKAELQIGKYLQTHIHKWPELNHVQIADKIYATKRLITYKNKKEEEQTISFNAIKSLVKDFFTARNEAYRILGNTEYIADTYLWPK